MCSLQDFNAGVAMTLYTQGRVSGPSSLLDLEVMAPADTVSHVNFDQWSGDMAVGSCGLVAIHAWQGVSSTRLHDQSSRKAGVRPLMMEPGTRLRHPRAAVTDHNVYVFQGKVVPSP